jgi:hypothetical protein
MSTTPFNLESAPGLVVYHKSQRRRLLESIIDQILAQINHRVSLKDTGRVAVMNFNERNYQIVYPDRKIHATK